MADGSGGDSGDSGGVRSWVGEAGCSVALIATGLWFAALARRMPMVEDSVPGPGLAPVILGLILAGLGIAIGVTAVARRSGLRVVVFDRDTTIAAALLAAAVGGFEPLGYVVSTFLFLLASFVAIGREPWLKAAVVAAAATAVTWAMFAKALGVALPAGLFAFL